MGSVKIDTAKFDKQTMQLPIVSEREMMKDGFVEVGLVVDEDAGECAPKSHISDSSHRRSSRGSSASNCPAELANGL